MIEVIIIGAGGHAKVVVDTIQLLDGFKILGLTEADSSKHETDIFGEKTLGSDNIIQNFSATKIALINAIGMNNKRREIYEKYIKLNYTFPNIIHPKAIVSKHVNLSDGIQIMAGVVIQPACTLGKNVIINTRASVDHDCIIGDHVHIAPGAVLCGGVSIGLSTFIGSGATILPGVKIGKECIVGAGGVVVKDVPDGVKVLGVPARSLANG